MAARATAPPSILVISDPGAGAEIGSLLAAAGFAEVHSERGGDEALERFESLRPDVVVMSASLAAGDARSLAAALKADGGEIVLVGDAEGPVRTARDAEDFAIDRFVARPLSADALASAVRAGRGRAPTERIDQAMEEAISSFVDDAMSALGGQLGRGNGHGNGNGRAAEVSREPTVILPGGGAPAASPADTSAPAGGERRRRPTTTGPRSAEADKPHGFGGELRRKMSAMAERLFPALGGERARVHAGLAHDAHADIDLNAIGEASQDATLVELPPEPEVHAEGEVLEPIREATAPDVGDEHAARGRTVTAELPGRGDLASTDIAVLMARLWNRGFTGRVTLRRAAAEKIIQLEEGRPVFASSNLPHDRMGDLLHREGKITREQHDRARDLVIESGRRMGEILVELGFIKPRELLPTVRRHLEDVIYSLFSWDSGDFSVTPGEAIGERISLTRHPAALILEGVRRKYDPARLTARLGSGGAVVLARPSRPLSAVVAVADLSPAERALIARLDGDRSLETAAASSELELEAAMQVAFVLVALGVAEIVDRGQGDLAAQLGRGPVLVGETDLAIDRQRVMTKYALVGESDYFLLLGVRRDASSFEIRRAYEAARRDFAADAFPAELQRELAVELDEITQLIEEAYRVLRDDRIRRAYLANLRD